MCIKPLRQINPNDASPTLNQGERLWQQGCKGDVPHLQQLALIAVVIAPDGQLVDARPVRHLDQVEREAAVRVDLRETMMRERSASAA
jgi:hypothetical protein